MVLQALKWDVSSVTPHDFLEHIVRRLPPQLSTDDVDTVRRHALTFSALCTAGTPHTDCLHRRRLHSLNTLRNASLCLSVSLSLSLCRCVCMCVSCVYVTVKL